MTEFVEDWLLSHTLGEGAYGEVKLVINKHTGDCVAMKVVDLEEGGPNVRACVEKEAKIHKLLKDKHLIRCYGSRESSNFFYIFLEYAPNGELFDRIEPDVGMPPEQAQKYMKQLIAGVAYLHRCGVTHRDIKPENLLLDKDDNLKISDLGLSTVFRYQGVERTLDKKCGTIPYVAPEVLVRRYAAAPADIWSCGIVLVTMLAGELPWDRASSDCQEYLIWRKGDYMNRCPWSKLDTLALSLLKSILNHMPSARPTPQQIAEHRWLKTAIESSTKTSDTEKKRIKETYVTLSQTVPTHVVCPDAVVPISFSQPTASIEELLLSSQEILATQTTAQQNSLQKLVRRMTRFYVSLHTEEAVKELVSVHQKLNLESIVTSEKVVTVTSIDKRKTPLIFKATVFLVNPDTTLIDFRLSKGDGLEFKKHFMSIRMFMKSFIVRPPSITEVI